MDIVMDTGRNIDEDIMEQKKICRRRRRKTKKRNQALCEDMKMCDQGAEKPTLGEILISEKMEISKSETQDTLDLEITAQCPIQEHHMDTTGKQVEKNTEKKKKRRRKTKKRNQALCEDMEMCDQGAEKPTLGEILTLEKMEIAKSETQNTLDVDMTAQCPIQEHHMDTTGNKVEKSTEKKKKRRRKKREAHQKAILQGMHQSEVVSALSLSDKPQDAGRNAGLNNIQATNLELQLSGRENFRPSDSNEERSKCDPVAVINGVNNSHPSPVRIPVVKLRRKLLILDVNGLLADVVTPPPKEIKADVNISRRAIFTRPFCRDFLRFCFERFDVGIWSSRSKKILDKVIDYLLGDMKHKLLFFWDKSQCTETQFKTLENRHKPIVFKNLRKIWEEIDPKLPWEKGDYNESNTLLLDDSPYKALLNPVHTGVFPYSYTFKDSRDNSLGPVGDLRRYLEGLANADNWKKYVEKHPFGQPRIDESSSCWAFYSKVLSSLSDP